MKSLSSVEQTDAEELPSERKKGREVEQAQGLAREGLSWPQSRLTDKASEDGQGLELTRPI